MKFLDLDLHPEILKAIQKLGYQETTPIQESAIPNILEGKDVAGLAQTGTGKTAAFICPLLDRLIRSKTLTPEQALDEKYQKRFFPDWKAQEFILVLVPTRELVDQVKLEVEKLRGDFPAKVLAIYGGTGYDKQIEGIKGGVDFVVGTPGRLIDLYKTHAIDFRQVRAIVFDEADRMFDMGFREDMKFILRRVPKTRQFLVFSATLNFEVLNIAYMHGADPVECNVSRDQAKAENVKDELFHCGQEEKPKFLLSLLKKTNPKQVIIFSNFKHNVERIAHFLNENEYPAVAISSLLTQAQRNRVIEQFKAENNLNILVATDLAARGLDIKGVDLVINFELSDDPENYVHRIGRTGRAGEEGRAISLVSDRDVEALQRIEEYLKHKVSIGWIEDTELLKEFKEFPRGEAFQRHGDRPRPQSGGRRDSGREGRRPGPRTERPTPSSSANGQVPQSDRPHQERHRNRDRHESNRSDRPIPSKTSEPRTEGSSQHRDRNGRHGGKQDNGRGQDNRTAGKANFRNDRNRGPRRDQQVKRDQSFTRRPLNVKKVEDKSLGSKITGFFKGLFGRSSS